MEIGTEAVQFLFSEYINGIFVAVWAQLFLEKNAAYPNLQKSSLTPVKNGGKCFRSQIPESERERKTKRWRMAVDRSLGWAED